MSDHHHLIVECHWHGKIYEECVLHSDDVQAVLNHVIHAHRAPYGGDCEALLDAELVEL